MPYITNIMENTRVACLLSSLKSFLITISKLNTNCTGVMMKFDILSLVITIFHDRVTKSLSKFVGKMSLVLN